MTHGNWVPEITGFMTTRRENTRTEWRSTMLNRVPFENVFGNAEWRSA